VKTRKKININWQNKVYDRLSENKFVPAIAKGGTKQKPSKPSTTVSIVTIDGKKMVVRKDMDGNVISRTPAQPLPKKKS